MGTHAVAPDQVAATLIIEYGLWYWKIQYARGTIVDAVPAVPSGKVRTIVIVVSPSDGDTRLNA